jgi:eukaryotic-like serine/threonine-protein kinase
VNDPLLTGYEGLADEAASRVDAACDQFESAWRRGQRPDITHFLDATEGQNRLVLLRELILIEIGYRRRSGEAPNFSDYSQRFPEIEHAWLDRALLPTTLPDLAATTFVDTRISPTQTIHGFEIQGELGRGGMGVVYKARDIRLNRIVALKTLVGGAFAATVDRERFRREAEAIASLDHPNIVPVYEVGAHAGIPYFSMKYFGGGSLARSPRRPTNDFRTVARLLESTARAVHHAHQRGVLHRDLKPSNVLLDEEGQPHVADFGLAKRFDPQAGPTDASTIAGTPAYMAPEQAAGRGELTTASDIYGLGVILYELLAGTPPFDGDSPLVVLRQLTENSPPRPSIRNPAVPRDLEIIALKCLEREPRRRYATAQELADDLERWQNDKPIVARPAPAYEVAWRLLRRHPLVSCLALLSAAAFTALLVTLTVSNQRITHALAEERATREKLSDALAREQQYLYFERVGSANRLWSANQTERAEQLLDLCPEHLRRWEWHYLNRLQQPNFVKLSDHTVNLTTVAMTNDGKRFATADIDGNIRLWDMATRKSIQTLTAGTMINRLAFSPDGTHLAVARWDDVSVFPLAGGESRRFNGGRWVAFNPDGTRFAVAEDNSVAIYEWPSGRLVRTLNGHSKLVFGFDFNHDGDRIVTTGGDQTVRTWDVESGKLLGHPLKFPQLVYSLHYLSDGRLFISQHNDSQILDAVTGDVLGRIPVGVHGADRFAISRDDRYFAGPTRDGAIKIWNLKTLEEEATFRGHPPYIGGTVFTRDSKELISVGHDPNVRIWRMNGRPDSRVLLREKALGGIAFTSDGRRLALALASSGTHGPEAGRLRILDVETGKELLRLDALGSPRFSPDDRWLATNRADGSVSLWDAKTGREIRNLFAPGQRSMRIAISPDGHWIASGTQAGSVLIWNLMADEPPIILEGLVDSVSSVAFSPDDSRLAACDRHGQVCIWNSDWEQTTQWQMSHALQVIAFSPDSQCLAMAGESSTVTIRNVNSGVAIHKLHGHSDWVSTLAFNTDGSRLITGSADETVKIWDVASGDEILTLSGLRGVALNVAADPTGRRIAVCESVVRVWETD